MEVTDDILVRQSQNGSLDAFNALVMRYEKKMYNLAYRFCGNHSDASDLAQEAFIRVFRSLKDFRGQSSFSTWLYRIASNVCVDTIRKERRSRVVSLDDRIRTEKGEITHDLPDWSANPEMISENHELQQVIQHEIANLPEEQRIVIILREIEGLSYEEIAQVTEISIGTVKSRINRGRNVLKDRLRMYQQGPDTSRKGIIERGRGDGVH